MSDDAETRVAALLSREPGYRSVLYKIMVLCEVPRTTTELEKAVLAFPEMEVPFLSPQTLLSWLTSAGAIEQVPSAGDPKAADGTKWQTTEAAKRVVEREAPRKRLRQLLAEQPKYRDIYLQVLRFCQTPRRRDEIDELLHGNPAMEQPRVFATFFVQNLEEKGGLEWVNRRWQTTEAGKGMLVESDPAHHPVAL